MLDPVTTAIITGAASNIVTQMLSGHVDALRAWIEQVFGGGSREELALPLDALEEDSTALERNSRTEVEVGARWSMALTAHLIQHPEVRSLIETMANGSFTTPGPTDIRVQHNYSTGTFIGGDNHGSIHPPQDRR